MGISIADLPEKYQRQALKKLAPVMPKANKFGAVKDTRGNLKFDSKGEAHRFDELMVLLMAGGIQKLQLQKSYVLQEGYTTIKGERIRPMTYKVDFYYIENGKEVVEDFKGRATRTYLDKVKLFKTRYPDIEFREVR